MLGFLVGVLFMLALPRRQAPPPPPAVPATPTAPPPAAPPAMTTIEAVFAQWGKYAVWDNDTTEVALWDSQTKDFTQCYQVLRAGDALFFRSIPHLTHPLLRHGLPDGENTPLQFTETAAQQREWLRASRDESWRAFTEAVHSGSATPPVRKAAP
jgi:hypothetical protein